MVNDKFGLENTRLDKKHLELNLGKNECKQIYTADRYPHSNAQTHTHIRTHTHTVCSDLAS